MSDITKESKNMEASPNQGGCWFCYQKDEREMLFSIEFDCYFHEKCLMDTLSSTEYNPEAEIIANEFDIGYESKEPDFDSQQ